MNKKYIISSDCPTGPKEIIKRYKYGELYKVKSENQLTNILNKFSLNKNLLIKLRKNINLNSVMFDTEYNLNQYYLNFIKSHQISIILYLFFLQTTVLCNSLSFYNFYKSFYYVYFLFFSIALNVLIKLFEFSRLIHKSIFTILQEFRWTTITIGGKIIFLQKQLLLELQIQALPIKMYILDHLNYINNYKYFFYDLVRILFPLIFFFL